MTWNVERVVNPVTSSPNDLVWDGRYLWASFNSSCKLVPYEILDRSDFDDIALSPGAYGDPRGGEYLNPITSVDIKTINTGGYWIAPYLNGAYVSQGQTFTQIKFIDIVTDEVTSIDVPTYPNISNTITSNLLCCNGKLWMCNTQKGGDQLFIYDIATEVWSHSTIPVREQETPRHLSHDKNGHVLITNFNDFSVCKYSITGTYISKAVSTNKEPVFIATDDNRNTFIASFNGMISQLDTDTDTITHFSFNGSGGSSYFSDFWGFESDNTNLWISTKGSALNRMNISSKQIIGTEVGDPVVIPDLITTLDDFGGMTVSVASPAVMLTDNGDGTWTEVGTSIKAQMDENYTLSEVGTGTYKKLVVIPQMTKQVWNGTSLVTKTYQKQIAVATSTGVFVFPNDKFWRANYAEVEAVAMVSSGQFDYTGD